MKFFIDMCILTIMNTRKVSNIRYASIREMDISNGEGIGVALLVQGCPSPHCKNCFNPETWDFNGGEKWTNEVEREFLNLIKRPYITRVSFLGGEPLAEQNLNDVLKLVDKIRLLFPNKTIWLYSGYTWEQIMCPIVTDDINPERDNLIRKRIDIVSQCDILVDGKFVDELKNISLKWRGSSNQRVIDVRKSLKQGKVVLYCD